MSLETALRKPAHVPPLLAKSTVAIVLPLGASFQLKTQKKAKSQAGFTNLSQEYRPRSLKALTSPPTHQGGQTRPSFAKVLGCGQGYLTLLSTGLPTHPPPTITLKSGNHLQGKEHSHHQPKEEGTGMQPWGCLQQPGRLRRVV